MDFWNHRTGSKKKKKTTVFKYVSQVRQRVFDQWSTNGPICTEDISGKTNVVSVLQHMWTVVEEGQGREGTCSRWTVSGT